LGVTGWTAVLSFACRSSLSFSLVLFTTSASVLVAAAAAAAVIGLETVVTAVDAEGSLEL
jgi:hypothetical protein